MNIIDLVDDAFRIGTLQNREELVGFTHFVCGISPKISMEIGTWKGGVTHILSKISEQVFTLDLDGYGDFDINKRNEFLSTYPNVKLFVANSHFVSTFNAVKMYLGNNKLDLLFIDGDHSYQGVKEDYFMYKDLVRSGGYIIFHDIQDHERWKGISMEVPRFWNDLNGNKNEITIRSDYGGFGILKKD